MRVQLLLVSLCFQFWIVFVMTRFFEFLWTQRTEFIITLSIKLNRNQHITSVEFLQQMKWKCCDFFDTQLNKLPWEWGHDISKLIFDVQQWSKWSPILYIAKQQKNQKCSWTSLKQQKMIEHLMWRVSQVLDKGMPQYQEKVVKYIHLK